MAGLSGLMNWAGLWKEAITVTSVLSGDSNSRERRVPKQKVSFAIFLQKKYVHLWRHVGFAPSDIHASD
jgi:hypothetical protein